MIRKTALACAAFAVGLAALPAGAATPAATVDPDLRCATWALVASSQEKDEAKKRGLGFMMAYFMGRYEARSGQEVEAQIKPDTVMKNLGNVEEANKLCAPRAQGFGGRLDRTIKGLQAPAAAAAPAAPATRSNPAAGDGR